MNQAAHVRLAAAAEQLLLAACESRDETDRAEWNAQADQLLGLALERHREALEAAYPCLRG